MMNMEENMPIASIVVLTYNQEKTIGRTLESLVHQKTNFSYEIIVCDDCSKDRTPDIIRDYAQSYPQIVPVLNEENLGVVRNNAKASSLCRGKYRAGCAGDDYWIDDDKLQKQVDILETHPNVCLVYTDAIVDSIGTNQRYVRVSHDPEADVYNQMLEACFLTAPTVCYRTSMLRSYDRQEILNQKFIMEDYPVLLELAYRYEFYHLRDVTVNYQVERITNENVEQALIDSCKFASESLRVQKYFINKYPERSKLSIEEAEDRYNNLCYRDMMYIMRPKDAAKHMRAIHKKTWYHYFMPILINLPLGMKIYHYLYMKKHPKANPLSFYFGGETCE